MSDQTPEAPRTPVRASDFGRAVAALPTDALTLGLEAMSALLVLDQYRALSYDESERVFAALQEARERMHSEEALTRYLILEDLKVVMDATARGTSDQTIMQHNGLTRSQLGQYRRAWRTIEAIHHAVNESEARKAQEEGTSALQPA